MGRADGGLCLFIAHEHDPMENSGRSSGCVEVPGLMATGLQKAHLSHHDHTSHVVPNTDTVIKVKPSQPCRLAPVPYNIGDLVLQTSPAQHHGQGSPENQKQ